MKPAKNVVLVVVAVLVLVPPLTSAAAPGPSLGGAPCVAKDPLTIPGCLGHQSGADIVMHEEWYDLGDLRSNVRGSLSTPYNVLDGQQFPVGIHVWVEDPIEGAVVEVLPSFSNLDGGRCSVTELDITGGTPLGENLYLIAPDHGLLHPPDDGPVAVGDLRIDWVMEASNPGRCLFSVEISNPLNPVPVPPLESLTSILPDISLYPIGLGHIQTFGGQTRTDRAEIIMNPDQTEYQVITAGDQALAVVSATISHHDGLSYKDWGEFTITPGADLGLLKKIAPHVQSPDAGDVVWSMRLHDDGDKLVWLTIVGLNAAPATNAQPNGTPNRVCLHGQYFDSGSAKGDAHNCMTVYGKKVQTVDKLRSDDQMSVAINEILSRTGVLLVPIGDQQSLYLENL